MRMKSLRLALAHYENRPPKSETELPASISLNCYDPEDTTNTIAGRVASNIEYKFNNTYDVFEYPWLTMEDNPLSPYSVY